MPTIEEIDDFSDPDDVPLEAPPPPASKAKAAPKAKPTATPAQQQQQRMPAGAQAPFAVPSTFKGQHNLRTAEPSTFKEYVPHTRPCCQEQLLILECLGGRRSTQSTSMRSGRTAPARVA